MEVERKKVSLIENTYAYTGRVSNKENAEEFKRQIQKYISALKEIVEANFDTLSDKDLYKLLTKVYDIYLDKEDYLKIISKYNNKQYTSFHRIPTTITFYDTAKEGHGKNFSWWKQLYQVYYIAATSDDIEFDYNKIYSKEEIKKMLYVKNIVILQKETEPIEDNPNFKQEKFEPLPILDIDIKDYGNNMSQFVLNNFYLFGEVLREKFTRRKVLKDMKEFIEILNKEIKDVYSDAQSNEYIYSGIARICKDWFESSEEKKEYQSLQKKLSSK